MLHDFAVALATFITIMGSVLAHDAQQISTTLADHLFPKPATAVTSTSPKAQAATAATSGANPFRTSVPSAEPQPPPPAKQIDVQPVATSPTPPQLTGEVLGVSIATQADFVSPLDLLNLKSALEAEFNARINSLPVPALPVLSFSGPAASTPVNTATFASGQKIDQLANVAITNATVNGVSGLTDADVPDTITASNYLPLTGGTLTGDLSLSGTLAAGTLSVAGVSSGGAVAAPYFSATSTSASSTFTNFNVTNSTTTNATSTNLFSTLGRFTTGILDSLSATAANIAALTATTITATNATTSRLDALDYVAVGRTATTTIRGDGAASTIPFASTTALTVSGTAYFPGSGIWNSSGNVGIGTTSPGISTSAGRSYLTIKGSSGSGVLELTSAAADADNILNGILQFTDANSLGRLALITARTSGSTANNRGGALDFWTKPDASSIAAPPDMELDNLGRLGIGTQSPGAYFEVSASNNASRSGTQDLLYLSSADGALGDRFVVKNGGNVGIGTTTPDTKLLVAGTHVSGKGLIQAKGISSSGYVSADTDTPASNEAGYIWSSGGAAKWYSYVGDGSTDLWFYNAATSHTVLTLKSSNDFLGLGNTSPTYKLDVTGLGHFTGLVDAANFVATSTSATSTFAGGLAVGSNALNVLANGNVGIGTAVPTSLLSLARASTGVVGDVRFSTAGTDMWSVGPLSDGTNTFHVKDQRLNADNIQITDASGGQQIIFGTNGTERFRIEGVSGNSYFSNGNLGIASSTPWAKLSVTNTGTGPSFVVEDSTSPDTTPFIIDASGNVGIGITSPLGKQHNLVATAWDTSSASGGQDALLLERNTAGGLDSMLGSIGFANANSGASARRAAAIAGVQSTSDADQVGLAFFTHPSSTGSAAITEAVRITHDGLVGIGTTSPWRTLSVTGTVGFDGLTGSTGAGSLCLDANKQVVYNAGSDACQSSTRATKHDITPLSLDNLNLVSHLQAVSFVYNQGDGRTRYGFIAEDTAAVDAHLATHDASGTVSGIDDRSIIAVLVGAVQALAKKLDDLAGVIAGFAERMITKELVATNVTADRGAFGTLTASSTIFGKTVTDELCVGTICITQDQFMSVFGASAHSQTAAAGAPIGESVAPAALPAQGVGGPPAPEAPNASTATTTTSPVVDPATAGTPALGHGDEAPAGEPAVEDAPSTDTLANTTTPTAAPVLQDTPPAANENEPVVELPATGTD